MAETKVREQTFPLNSRRLTSSVISRVAAALEVPAGGSLEDTRQMLEGKLVEVGREPRNVQVVLSEEEHRPAIRLEDGEGVFLEVPRVASGAEGEDAARVSGGGEDSDSEGGGGGAGITTIRGMECVERRGDPTAASGTPPRKGFGRVEFEGQWRLVRL